MSEEKAKYLGDGLYAEYDGYQVCLKANSLECPSDTVYLDQSVLSSFINYLIEEKIINLDLKR